MSGIAHGECGEIGWFPLWLSLSFLFTLGEFSLLLCSGFLIRHWLYTCSNFEFWTEELMETDGPWNIVCFDMFCPINSSRGKSYSLKTSCCCFWKMQFNGRSWVGKDHCIQPLGSIMISMVGDASFFLPTEHRQSPIQFCPHTHLGNVDVLWDSWSISTEHCFYDHLAANRPIKEALVLFPSHFHIYLLTCYLHIYACASVCTHVYVWVH